jgi:hypothetical protein
MSSTKEDPLSAPYPLCSSVYTKYWVSHLLDMERDSSDSCGTYWPALQYALLVSSAKRVYARLVERSSSTPLCLRQAELPFASLHALPPRTTEVGSPGSWHP